jgi:cellulose biosynthesis protein BcsQ
MQVLIIDTTPQLRASLLGRVQEAGRQAGMQRLGVVEVDPLNLDELSWASTVGVFVGVGSGSMIKELLGKIQGAAVDVPVAIVLDPDTYASEAVAIHKVLGREVVCETDLTQMANFIVDCERHASGRPLGVRARHVVGVVHLKGGVGASTIAAGLGSCIAKAGYTTAIMDLDDVTPTITEWARVSPSQRSLVGELLRVGEVTTDRLRDLVAPVEGYGGRLVVVGTPQNYADAFHLKASVLDGAPAASSFVNSTLSLLSSEYEIVLIDMGRSWGVATFSALPWCERVVLVMDDDGLAVRRSLDGLVRLKQESGDPDEFALTKWSIVLNKWSGKRLSEGDIRAAVASTEVFPEAAPVFMVGFSERGRQWGAPSESIYDLASVAVKRQIEALAKALVPSREGKGFGGREEVAKAGVLQRLFSSRFADR